MVRDLTSSYGGIKLKNPIFGSSSPATQQPEICKKAYEYGAAALVLKTSFSEVPETLHVIGHPGYRIADWSGRGHWRPIPPKKTDPVIRGKKGVMKPPYSAVLIIGSGATSSFWIGDDYIDYYNACKKVIGDDCLLIPSIYAATEKGWEAQCRRVNKMKAKAVHLNLACPIVAGWEGIILSEKMKVLKPYEPPAANTEVTRYLTQLVVDGVDCPVIVKLPPFAYANVDTALAVQEVGGQGVELADSYTAPILRIDPETATPGWDPSYPSAGGGWGPWIIAHLCGQIVRMKKAGLKIDIAAVGGVETVGDIVRYTMAGASCVGSARTIMVEGWVKAADWLEGLEKWMEEKGYNSLAEIRGMIVDKVITDMSKLERSRPHIIGGPLPIKQIVLDEKKCIGCGWCEACCMHCAITMVNEKPVIAQEMCEACGMCESVCPVDALSLQRRG